MVEFGGDELAKFELTFGQYISAICQELCSNLSEECKVITCKEQIGMSLRAIAKDYPEYDCIKITWEKWNFVFDTKEIELAYKREIDIQTITSTIIGDAKKEFVKQLVNG